MSKQDRVYQIVNLLHNDDKGYPVLDFLTKLSEQELVSLILYIGDAQKHKNEKIPLDKTRINVMIVVLQEIYDDNINKGLSIADELLEQIDILKEWQRLEKGTLLELI